MTLTRTLSRTLPYSADKVVQRTIQTLSPMQNQSGGFGAGHGQTSHCAASYAAVLSLAMVGGNDGLEMVDRRSL